VASGTAALDLTLAALGVGEGDEVVTTPFTFPATVNAILRSGATVRFADIGDDLVLSPAAVAETLTDRTAAIVAVHLFGLPCDVDAMSSFGPPVLEDAAQAHLATLDGRPAGGLGVAGCFSFYASKNMTTGEGGAVTSDDAGLAERISILRNQGMRERYAFEAIGWNLRMSEMAAAIGRVQLRHLPAWTAARRRVAEMLTEALFGIDGFELPTVPAGREHAWHRYTVRLDPGIDRDAVHEKLHADGIQAAIHYRQIVPDMDPYVGHPRIGHVPVLEVARAAARSVLSVPVHPNVTDADVERMAFAVRSAVAAARGEPS
jgi:dTDP-4-amino-4,6-dideoxygalactose transaminase